MKKLTQFKKEYETLEQLKKLEDSETNRIKKTLQKNNTKLAIFEDVKKDIVNIWNKYQNKTLGDKTKEKIEKEIESAFDGCLRVWISKDYYASGQSVNVTLLNEQGYSNGFSIKIITKNLDTRFISKENKVQEIKIENIKEQDTTTHIDNIDDATTTIERLHAKAEQLQKELNDIHKEIGVISNYDINCVEYTHCVKHWIM